MQSNTLALLVGLGVAGTMLALGSMADAQKPEPSNDPITPAIKAIEKWSGETGTPLAGISLNENKPGDLTDMAKGSVVVDISPGMIRFMTVGEDGRLKSSPGLAGEFSKWLKEHPELL